MVKASADNQVAYWSGELERAKKRFRGFWDGGDSVIDVYRQQKSDGNDALSKDKYNILYSSTETIRPNLYAQTPIPYVVLRNKDTATDAAQVAALILENSISYIMDEEDFDELMDSVVEDFLLPGLGTGWVRYSADIGEKVQDGKPVYAEDGKTPVPELLDEMVHLEYVYWQDFLTGVGRTWKQVPWVAKRLWLSKKDAGARFTVEKANQLQYLTRDNTNRELDNPGETAEVWEIWNKKNKTVYWYGEGLDTLLDEKPDPLKLKRFFPCPRPIRAIYNTRSFVPRPLYSQYKSQAETLNVLTKRIRLLGEALRVVGLYDGSQQRMADVLNPAAGNRMIAVDAWALFAQNGGINGSVQWVPIDAVVKALVELLKAREVCKQEIYEITGFSDIVRGVSKASETLGAQNIKADWAGARVKKMQKEIQRFARDLLALAGELIAEHCSPETLAVFSGVSIPDPQAVQTDPSLQQQVQTFKEACDLIKSDIRRLSTINIETDSTLAANQEQEREDRAKFLAASGAFLQQAVPAMQASPELGPLLGALLLFTVRSFPSSRPIQDEFEKVAKAMAAKPQEEDKDGKKAAAAAAKEKVQAENAAKGRELEIRQSEAAAKAKNDEAKIANEGISEQHRHDEKMKELDLKLMELRVREREARVKEQLERTERFKVLHEAALAEMGVENEVDDTIRNEEIEHAWLDDAEADRERDREAQGLDLEDAQAEREATLEAAKAEPEGEGTPEA
jgi:hypothetical protein